MKKSSDLFQLIKSMSKSEKRYFKLHASIHKIGKENIYVKLFVAIEKMETYDEEIIKKKFAGEKFAASLFSTKNYLFNIILKCLTEYHASGSVRHEINRIIDEYLILIEKGMFKQAEKKLKKAKAVTLKNEMFELALDILNMENLLLTRVNFTGRSKTLYLKNSKEKIQLTAKLNNFNEIITVYQLLTAIWQQDKMPDLKDREWIGKNVTRNPLFKNENNALSNKAKLLYYRALFISSEINLDTQKSYNILKKIVEHSDQHSEILNNFTGQYINSLSNLISIEITLNKHAEAEKNIRKLKNLTARLSQEKQTLTTKASIFHYSQYLMFVLFIETNRIQKGLEIINETESMLKHYKGYLLKYMVMQFYFFYANLYFLNDEYDNTLKWLNKILNENATEVSPDIMSYSRILRLIIHYEKNDLGIIEYLIRSTKLFLFKSQRTYKFEKLVLGFFTKVLRVSPGKETDVLYHSFKKDLLLLIGDPYENLAIENLDLLAWIESKLQNKPIRDILNEKKGRHSEK